MVRHESLGLPRSGLAKASGEAYLFAKTDDGSLTRVARTPTQIWFFLRRVLATARKSPIILFLHSRLSVKCNEPFRVSFAFCTSEFYILRLYSGKEEKNVHRIFTKLSSKIDPKAFLEQEQAREPLEHRSTQRWG